MDGLLRHIQEAVRAGHVEISDHAYEQLIERNIDFEQTIAGLEKAILLKDYSAFTSLKRVLVSQSESDGTVIHVVWDAPDETTPDAVLVTAFRPGSE
jgi:hypothetical protein